MQKIASNIVRRFQTNMLRKYAADPQTYIAGEPSKMTEHLFLTDEEKSNPAYTESDVLFNQGKAPRNTVYDVDNPAVAKAQLEREKQLVRTRAGAANSIPMWIRHMAGRSGETGFPWQWTQRKTKELLDDVNYVGGGRNTPMQPRRNKIAQK